MSSHIHLFCKATNVLFCKTLLEILKNLLQKKGLKLLKKTLNKAEENGCFGCLKELERKTVILNLDNFGNKTTNQ
jgi:hypothetical protein